MKMIGMATVGRDAEVRYTPSDDAVANLSLAVNFYDKNADNNRGTQWVNATMWGKQAESLAQYMTKGSRHCFVLSDVHLREWENNGKSGVSLEARVDSVELGPRADKDGASSPAPAPRQQQRGNAPAPAPKSSDMDDDIPFD